MGVRIVMLGMPCPETGAALGAMRQAGVEVAAVILASAAPMGDPEPPGHGLRRTGPFGLGNDDLPVTRVPRPRPEGAAAIARARPDLIVTACFPWRLPPAVLSLPPLGCLNIHPSLLPRGRGPEPVFWTFRRGERVSGVTVHLMDAGLDTGPILAQEPVEVLPGSRAPELERDLMARGGRLVAELLPAWARGEMSPQPQDDASATLAPPPTPADFEIATDWAAEAAYAFAAGVAPLRGPLAVRVVETEQVIPVADALDHAAREAMDAPTHDEGRGVVRVRFGPGWVRFLTAAGGRYALSLSPIRARDIR